MAVGTALGIAAGTATGVLGARSQKKAAERAADATTQAADTAAGIQRQNFLDTVRLHQPRAEAGDAAMVQMMGLLGLEAPESLVNNTAYDDILTGATGADPFSTGYFAANPDVEAAFQDWQIQGGADAQRWNRKMLEEGYDLSTPEGYAQYHYDKHGRTEGRQVAPPQQAPVQNNLTGEPGEPAPSLDPTAAIKATPGYEFRFNEGLRAVDSSAANRGMLMSGSQLRRLQEFGDQYASSEFNNYWNRLAGVAGAGQVATQGIAGAGGATANNLASIAQTQGANLASSYQQQGFGQAGMWNALGQGLGAFGGYYDERFGSPQVNRLAGSAYNDANWNWG